METKEAVLSNGLIIVPVPSNAERFEIIGNILEFAYFTEYSMKFKSIRLAAKCAILGTINEHGLNYDCDEYLKFMYSGIDSLNNFKSLIESETGYLFENPVQKPDLSDVNGRQYDPNVDEALAWRKYQERQAKVVEKFLILKETK